MVLKLGRFGQQIRNTWKSSEMWCWRRMEKISWVDHVRNGDVLFRVREHSNILHEIQKRKANWIGHILTQKLPSKASYRRKHKGRDGSEKKMRKKEEEDERSYWMTLRTGANTLISKHDDSWW
jgi:hypothetical protein